jgi:acyl-homoserine lactone acylase PvdQ
VARALSPLINIQPVGVGGDQDCVNALNIAASVDPLKFTCDSGPTQRLLIDMADKDRFYQTLTLGQSEHLTSSYRQDQLKNWLTLRPHSIALSREQMEKQQQHKVVFTNR